MIEIDKNLLIMRSDNEYIVNRVRRKGQKINKRQDYLIILIEK